ncbi:MAG: hypothetical protein ACXWUR_11575 [Allosphingosinicella sp.]
MREEAFASVGMVFRLFQQLLRFFHELLALLDILAELLLRFFDLGDRVGFRLFWHMRAFVTVAQP